MHTRTTSGNGQKRTGDKYLHSLMCNHLTFVLILKNFFFWCKHIYLEKCNFVMCMPLFLRLIFFSLHKQFKSNLIIYKKLWWPKKRAAHMERQKKFPSIILCLLKHWAEKLSWALNWTVYAKRKRPKCHGKLNGNAKTYSESFLQRKKRKNLSTFFTWRAWKVVEREWGLGKGKRARNLNEIKIEPDKDEQPIGSNTKYQASDRGNL